jgi:hypothetical protein
LDTRLLRYIDDLASTIVVSGLPRTLIFCTISEDQGTQEKRSEISEQIAAASSPILSGRFSPQDPRVPAWLALPEAESLVAVLLDKPSMRWFERFTASCDVVKFGQQRTDTIYRITICRLDGIG